MISPWPPVLPCYATIVKLTSPLGSYTNVLYYSTTDPTSALLYLNILRLVVLMIAPLATCTTVINYNTSVTTCATVLYYSTTYLSLATCTIIIYYKLTELYSGNLYYCTIL